MGDDRGALRGNAFIVIGESSEARPVLLTRISNDVDHLASIAQRTQLVESEERCAREIRLHSKHAIEFDGVSDGFVDLQSKLRTIENHVELSFGALLRTLPSNRFFRNASGVLYQFQLFD